MSHLSVSGSLLWGYLLESGPRDGGVGSSGSCSRARAQKGDPGERLAAMRGRWQNRVRGAGQKTCPKGAPGGPFDDFLGGSWGGVLAEGATMNISGI